jgi:hypothetical protein
MTESENAANRGDGRGPKEDDYDRDAPRPFLGPLVKTLQPYRRIIWGALGLAALLVVAAGLAAWTLYPTEKTASLEFHVDFDGAGSGLYPNGAKFSTEDFLSEPVVRRVFDQNGLEKYTKYERFRNSLIVSSVNPDLEILEGEFRSRLADTKVQPLDRLKLEREFREKATALKTSAFKLTMVRTERLREMDKVLAEKVLRDILTSWAEDAAKIRGVLQYDLPIYSTAMLQKEFLETEDYLISADLLRRKVARVSASIDLLMKVPGIQVYRLPGSGASLPEVRLRIEDIGSFRIAPTLSLIRATGLSKNPVATMRYIEDRLFETTRAQKLAQDQEGKVRDGLEAFIRTEKSAAWRPGGGGEGTSGGGREPSGGMVIPQLSESFLDRLMALGGSKGDSGFRKDLTERMITSGLLQAQQTSEVSYYKELQTAFKSGSRSEGNAATLQEIQTRFSAIIAEMEKSLKEIQQLYEMISARNLRPASALFGVEKPMTMDSESAFSVRRFLGLGMLFVAFVGFITAVGALLHARFGGSHA